MKFFQPIARVIENSTIRVTAARRQKMLMRSVQAKTFSSKPTYYGLLYKNDQNEWRITDQYGMEQIPCGVYTFVRTTLGFIRVAPAPQGTTNHLEVANYAAEVLYAGEIAFNTQGKMLSWNNQSGGYRPNFYQASQAGLPLDIFCPVYSDSKPIVPHSDPKNLQGSKSLAGHKRKLSPLLFVAKAYNQSRNDDGFTHIRKIMRKHFALANDSGVKNNQITVKCMG